MTATSIAKLADEALLQAVHTACREANRLLGLLLVLLIEVDERRLHLREASPSLFEFCRRHLRMSEGQAFRRINAARLVKRFPRLLQRIEQGDVHLSALVQLRDYLTEENLDELVDAAKGKGKMEIAELIARIAPRPDVPARIRKLPHYDRGSRVSNEPKPSLEPLSEARYRLQLTGSREFRDKLFRLRDFMMHVNPYGDLGVVVERAVDELLERYEKKAFGRSTASPAEPTPASEVTPAPRASREESHGRTADELRETALRGLARTTCPASMGQAKSSGRRFPSEGSSASASSEARQQIVKRARSSKPPAVARSG
jgi:hypothetical protein